MSECALSTDGSNNGTCFNNEQVSLITNYTNGNTLDEVKKETNCDDDMCVLEKSNIPADIKGKLIRESFKAPAASFDHNYWLNNTEIDTVMSQLRIKYPGFAHGFIHMSDLKSFDPSNLKSFDYPVCSAEDTDFPNEFKYALIQQKLIKGELDGFKPKLSTHNNVPLQSYGIICNTDTSKGSGQHWFAIFISTDQKNPDDTSKPWIRIELFNSAGGGSSNSKFDEYWQDQAMQISRVTGVRCTFDIITTIVMQGDTGNCGSYSLFYIYTRLRNTHPSSFDNPKKIITDYSMQKFRHVCFRIDKDSLF